MTVQELIKALQNLPAESEPSGLRGRSLERP